MITRADGALSSPGTSVQGRESGHMRRRRLLRFEGFTVDLDAAEIRRGEEVVRVEPQVFDLIALLCQNPGRVLGHDELIAHVWRGRIVSDSAIATRVNAARKALGDDGAAQRIIKTVRGRGFRFEPNPLGTAGAADAPGDGAARFVMSCTPHGYSLLMTTRRGAARDDWREALPSLLGAATRDHAGEVLGPNLAVFDRATDAVACASALLEAISKRCESLPESERWTVKVGISHGGPGDDTAAARAGRLDAVAHPGGVCATAEALAAAREIMDVDVEAISVGAAAGGSEAFRVLRIGDAALTPSGRLRVPQLACIAIPEPAEVSVVVLPFEVVGSDAELEPVATGLRLEIQNALAQLSGVLPMAAGTAAAYRGVTSPDVADALGLRYVVQGNLRRSDRRARLMLELYDHRRGGVTWSRSYDGSLDQGFEFQDDMTARVLTALDVKILSGEQARVWRRSLKSAKAIQLQYRGMHDFFKMTRENVRAARESFERLHQMCPDVSIGATWIAVCHWFELQRGWAECRQKTAEALKRWANIAIGMEDADGQAHTALCHVHLLEHDYDKALEIGERAVTVRPSCANANGFYGHALYYCGVLDKAVHHTKLAIRASPAYPPLFGIVLAGTLHARGDHEGAVAVAKEAVRLNPADVLGRILLCSALVEAGRRAEARDIAEELRAFEPARETARLLADLPFRRPRMREQIVANIESITRPD